MRIEQAGTAIEGTRTSRDRGLQSAIDGKRSVPATVSMRARRPEVGGVITSAHKI